MEIRMSAEELQRALYRAQGIVDRRATMPILANVLLEAEGDRLVVSATDLEIGLRGDHPAEVTAAGRVTVPARHLLDIVKNLPQSEVSLKRVSGDRIEITSGKARFKIVGAAADDFPALPEVDDVPLVDLPAETLSEMVEKTHYAVSTDETRYNLNGVYVEQDGGTLRMVATDGHRLALMERAFEGDFKLDRGVIVPRKGLAEMRRLLAEKPGTVSLGFSGTNAVFRTEGLVLVMRLVDGQFPDYRQVIPDSGKSPVVVGREAFLGTLKRVRIVSGDRAPAVRLKAASGVLTVFSENPDLGEATEEIEVDYTGGELAVGFNANYLIDVLSVLTDAQVRLDVSDELSPGILRPEGDAGYTAVVMPMRI
jgi:DNA polymerase III subunit beta